MTIGLVVFVPLCAVYVYTRLTCGICKCSKHLVGKVVIVTGGNAGIGYEAAKDFAERGARVILACRNDERGIAARDKIRRETGNEDVHFKKLDLASFASIRTFADDIIKNEKRLDILVNNAGMVMKPEKILTEDGLLVGMQANHFGPFLMTYLLLDKVKTSAPSRIINVSSSGHFRGKVEFDNLNMEKETSINPFRVYVNSKLCNILMTIELARQLQGTGVTTYSLCPGAVFTDIVYDIHWWWYQALVPLFRRVMMKSPREGAQTTIYLAVSPDVTDFCGKYFKDCAVAKTSKLAQDENLARKLWEVSEKICKV